MLCTFTEKAALELRDRVRNDAAKLGITADLSGLIVGIILAIVYRKQGPQRPKYQYEIEKELGIEPPDFEGDLRRAIAAEQAEIEAASADAQTQSNKQTEQAPTIVVYDYKKND